MRCLKDDPLLQKGSSVQDQQFWLSRFQWTHGHFLETLGLFGLNEVSGESRKYLGTMIFAEFSFFEVSVEEISSL